MLVFVALKLQQALNGPNNEARDEISRNFLEISLKVPSNFHWELKMMKLHNPNQHFSKKGGFQGCNSVDFGRWA